MTPEDQEKPWEQPGSIFDGKYRIIRRLGTGAFGGVYLAEHILMQKKVAIKLLHESHSGNTEAVRRFQREAQAAANIDHPNICAATDYGIYNDTYYIVMEYLDGKSLYEIETEIGRFDTLRALHIVIQVCSALEKAHESGIVHRDLKPENIVLVEHEGDPDFVKITDFGIAQIDTKSEDVRLTQAGMVYGSPLYLSPEQARADVIDQRSDLYSVGVILYELITAKLPFMGETAAAVLAKHVTDPPPPFSVIAPDLDSDCEIEQIVLKLLSKNPQDRFQSANELRDTLLKVEDRIKKHGIAAGFSLSQRLTGTFNKLPKKERGLTKAFVILMILLIAIIAAIFTFRYLSQRKSTDTVEAEQQQNDPDLIGDEDSAPEVDVQPVIKSRNDFVKLEPVANALALFDKDKQQGIVALKKILGIATTEELAVQPKPEPPPKTIKPSKSKKTTKNIKKRKPAKKGTRSAAKTTIQKPADPVKIELSPMNTAHLYFLLAKEYYEATQWDESFDALEHTIKEIPNYGYDPELLTLVFAAMQSGYTKPKHNASEFLNKHINRPAGRRLAELAEHDQVRLTRKISLEILEQTGYFKKLPKWNRLTIRLRHAQGCEENRKYIVKIGELKDARALGALRRFTAHPTTGCGADKQEDCWGCLRPDLRKAVNLLEGRQ